MRCCSFRLSRAPSRCLRALLPTAILDQPRVIAMLAVPILIQAIFNAGLAHWLNRRLGESYSVACPSALIGSSNFLELAVAAAIGLFGFGSGAALATVVGVLIEVPVMLLVVRVVNQSKGWYEAGAGCGGSVRQSRGTGYWASSRYRLSNSSRLDAKSEIPSRWLIAFGVGLDGGRIEPFHPVHRRDWYT